MTNAYQYLAQNLVDNQNLVVVTLIKTNGSTPQVKGATAIFNKDALVYGTIGGGILEKYAEDLAKRALTDGRSCIEEYSFNANINDEEGAVCGGTACFFIDADPQKNIAVFNAYFKAIQTGKSGYLISLLCKEKSYLKQIKRGWIEEGESLPKYLKDSLKTEKDILKNIGNNCSLIEREEFSCFIEPLRPKPELILIGSGHIGKALCKYAGDLGFKIKVFDQREELTTKERFPDADEIVCGNLVENLSQVKFTDKSYVVIATQGHREDRDALRLIINKETAYVGMIGSKRKVALMKEQFLNENWTSAEQWERIYAPIGLDIQAETVPEIAMSIAAQLVKLRRVRERKDMVNCLVLAAGKSTRMQQQKLLMPWNDTSIIESVVDAAKKSNASTCVVVTGSHHHEVSSKLSAYSPIIVENLDYESGMLSSIQTGIKAMPKHCGAFVLLLGDQPMVSANIINQLIENYRKASKGIILPTYNGRRGHPILIDMKYREDIYRLDPNKGLRELIHNYPDDILEVKVHTDRILKDIDTPEEYDEEHGKTLVNK